MNEYRTSEVAKIIGVHPNTIRFYEDWGLISKPKRKTNGYRIYTDLHVLQMRLARMAFDIEILQNGLRKKIINMVKTAATCDFDTAIRLTEEYREQLVTEQTHAEEAIELVKDILCGKHDDIPTAMRRKETATYLGVTTDTLRNWELNGLICVKRSNNGYRIYTSDDLRQLKIIRSLRCANYSLESILRMLHRLSTDSETNIKNALNTPRDEDDIISVCDHLLDSLSCALDNSKHLLSILNEMKSLS